MVADGGCRRHNGGVGLNRRKALLGMQDESAEGRIAPEGNSHETLWR